MADRTSEIPRHGKGRATTQEGERVELGGGRNIASGLS
jgi:hypothetical protein